MTSSTQNLALAFPATPRFQRAGGAWQLCLDSLPDLRHALELDDALWVANSAPLSTIVMDPVFLRYLDQDGDGRLRVDSVRIAILWLLDHLEPEPLGRPGETTLGLDAIRPEGQESAQLLATARKVARHFGPTEAKTVALDQVRQIIRKAEEGGVDRPGLVRPESAAVSEVRELIGDARATVNANGSIPPSAITREQLEKFLADARRYLDWLDEARLAGDRASTPLMPLGAATMTAFDLYTRIAPRLDHFFALCDAVKFSLARGDTWIPARENSPPGDWNHPEAVQSFLNQAPLAWPTPEGRLDFAGAINPHWRAAVEAFRRDVLEPLLGAPASDLDALNWQRVKQLFAAHADWRLRQPATLVSRIPPARLRRYLDRPELAEQVRALITSSKNTAFDLDDLRRLEKLLLFQSHLLRLANSFINFSDLYHPERRGLFEMGTLIMDGRRFTFSVKVVDRALHARFSNTSNMFVLYAEITGDGNAKLYEVAVPVTAGTKGTLQLDKWGMFIDCEGRTFNARIVQIVENPISLREAIAAPFKRLGRALMIRFGEKSAEEEKKLQTLTTQALVTGAPTASRPERRPAFPFLTNSGGMVAGGGIAIAALGSSLVFITKTLSELEWPTIVAGFVGAAAAVIVPITIVAMIKLAGRDLSCMLEGSGWGINARMALTRSLARTFTRRPVPKLFPLKTRTRRRLWWWLLLLLLVFGVAGLIRFWL